MVQGVEAGPLSAKGLQHCLEFDQAARRGDGEEEEREEEEKEKRRKRRGRGEGEKEEEEEKRERRRRRRKGRGGGRGGDEERFITPLQSCDHAYHHLIHFPPSLHPYQWIQLSPIL